MPNIDLDAPLTATVSVPQPAIEVEAEQKLRELAIVAEDDGAAFIVNTAPKNEDGSWMRDAAGNIPLTQHRMEDHPGALTEPYAHLGSLAADWVLRATPPLDHPFRQMFGVPAEANIEQAGRWILRLLPQMIEVLEAAEAAAQEAAEQE